MNPQMSRYAADGGGIGWGPGKVRVPEGHLSQPMEPPGAARGGDFSSPAAQKGAHRLTARPG